MSKIVVVADARSGRIKKPTLEAVGAAVDLAAKCNGSVVAFVAGADNAPAVADLQKSGAAQVVSLRSPALASYSGDGYAKVIHAELGKHAPSVVLMPHTAMGRDLAPRIAALLDAGMVSDATALHFEGGRFGATKPVYAGKAYRKYLARRAPFVATLRPNVFEIRSGGGATTTEVAASIGAGELLAVVKELAQGSTDRVPLQEARVIVAAGRGMRGPEHFGLIEDLTAAFGPGVGAIGASRAIVDAGWRPHREQVGQTGKVVSPQLYFAIGISGAIQHLAGMRTARCIVAINKDANAPIFKVAHYGIVGDAFEVLPALTAAIKAAVAH
ncbi:MAG: electron transfer flavoprotein subunit alpha/FixB family protein [Planctomycetes bacterium]|nr:electron transfer flavoprotein subunit alpha/FixB family protein [Planctomycetota bacterium]